MPALPAGYSPSVEAVQTGVVRLQKRQFGDGYLHVSPDGINPVRYEWQLEFRGLDLTQGNNLFNFFMGLNGITPFFVQWTAPDGLSGDWMVEDVQRRWESNNISHISCKFVWFQAV